MCDWSRPSVNLGCAGDSYCLRDKHLPFSLPQRSQIPACAIALLAAGLLLALSAGTPAFAARQTTDHRVADLNCMYDSRADHAIHMFKSCAWKDQDGHLHVTLRHLRRLSYDRHGLATILIGQWFYVRRSGRLAPVMTFDNVAEPFSHGLARSPVGEKIGYIDRRLRLVIPARYDGALRFESSVAAVCMACKLVSDGDHADYDGGMWGCIDRRGNELGPFRPGLPNERFDAVCSGLHKQHSVPRGR
jgi:WG containing repeat